MYIIYIWAIIIFQRDIQFYSREDFNEIKKITYKSFNFNFISCCNDHCSTCRAGFRRNTDKNTLCHAEITAIKRASKVMGDWRLEGCSMYVTLEPCQMCAGACVQARIDKVVIGCMSPKSGCAGSVINILQMEEFNHQVEIVTDVLSAECSEMLTKFFEELRVRNKQEKLKKAEIGDKNDIKSDNI